MFQFKKKKEIIIQSPTKGAVIALEKVQDPVFAQHMMGDGIALMPEENIICAPIDGTITLIADTLHAIGITSNEGVEILIHVGLDTVQLKGHGFVTLCEINQTVKAGTPLLQLDLAYFQEQNVNLTTPIIILNTDQYEIHKATSSSVVTGDIIMRLN